MKKFSIFALVVTLIGTLCACNRSDKMPQETTGITMPTIITTEPYMENTVPGTSFHPDQDGMIGETEDTTRSTDGTEPQPRHRMRLR